MTSGGVERFFSRIGFSANQRDQVKEDIRERLRRELLLQRISERVPAPTEKEIKEEMEAIRSQITDHTDFAALATKHSESPDSGGDLGFFARGQMVKDFEDVVFGMKTGQVSEVFETEFGYHIAKVLDRKPAVPCPVHEVRPVIVRELTEQARHIERFVDAEKEKARIEDR